MVILLRRRIPILQQQYYTMNSCQFKLRHNVVLGTQAITVGCYAVWEWMVVEIMYTYRSRLVWVMSQNILYWTICMFQIIFPEYFHPNPQLTRKMIYVLVNLTHRTSVYFGCFFFQFAYLLWRRGRDDTSHLFVICIFAKVLSVQSCTRHTQGNIDCK